jgi:adenylate cyclase
VGRRAAQLVHRTDYGPLIRSLLSGFWRGATRLSPWRVALLATLALCLGYLPASQAPAVQQLEAQLLDLRFRLRPAAPLSDDIVLVLIDEDSIREVGRWPWSREVIADALARLAGAGARTIGIDLLFAEAELGTVPRVWLDRLREALSELEDQDASGLQPEQIVTQFRDHLSGDPVLAAEIGAAKNVVLPYSFGFGAPTADLPQAPPVVANTAFRVVHRPSAAASTLPLLVASGLLAPIPELAEAADTLGHTNIALDRDGAARFEFPAVAYKDRRYPSFALEMARHHLAVSRDQVRLEVGRGVWLRDRLVPTDDLTRLVVNYHRPGRFPVVSFARLLTDEIPAAEFNDKVVLIGGSAAGVGDRFVTPFTPVMPGIERHATVIDNVLRQDFVVRRNDTVLLDLGSLVLGGLVLGGLAQRRGLLGPSLGLGALVAVVFAANLFAFFEFGLWLNLFLPLFSIVAIYTAVVLYKYFIGERQERQLRAAFKHYLSPTLVEQVARDPALLRLGGEQKELTVLFADLRDSTRLGGKLPPAAFAQLLNEVMETMTRVLFAHDGMLDKFTGDGLVAVFGAPLPQPDHPLRACRAALAMVEELEPVQRKWARTDLPPLDIGIGINTGSMLIGNMGSKERFSYTVIGDEANLGARLEAANKDFQTRILISGATWQRVKDEIAARELDLVTFRGMARPVRVFEVRGTRPLPRDEASRLERVAAGLALYRQQQWIAAKALFEQILAVRPDDRPSQIYLERCRARLAGRREATAAK